MGGPAVRWPTVLYWPPWQGQAKPPPTACTGQPRCMQRFENTTNIASLESQSEPCCPVLCTQARPGLVAGFEGSSTYVAAVGLKWPGALASEGKSPTFPRKTGWNWASSNTGASM